MLLLGARQVGKTYIIREFCKTEYKNYIEINLFQNHDIIELYKNNNLNSEEKFIRLKALLQYDIDDNDNNNILFFDEIQESEELISEMKYFNEVHPTLRIICAGSLLGVKLKRMNTPFPVGRISRLTLYPMDFEEFLIALNQQFLIDDIKKCFETLSPMMEPFHTKALGFYRYFLITGGMPEIVKNFVDANCDIIKCNLKNRNNILESYFDDMNKYVTDKNETLKIKRIYNSIGSQLSKENKKFKYSDVDKNARKRDYELSLDWLKAANLVLFSYRVKKPLIPLEGFKDIDQFKLFYSDIGFLSSVINILPKDILTDNISLYKSAIVENYVANQLIINEHNLYYWQSDGIAEIDFLLYTNDGIIPLEVKSSDNVKSKSLNTYIDQFKPKYSYKISTKSFSYNEEERIKSIPLYAVFCIK